MQIYLLLWPGVSCGGFAFYTCLVLLRLHSALAGTQIVMSQLKFV